MRVHTALEYNIYWIHFHSSLEHIYVYMSFEESGTLKRVFYEHFNKVLSSVYEPLFMMDVGSTLSIATTSISN